MFYEVNADARGLSRLLTGYNPCDFVIGHDFSGALSLGNYSIGLIRCLLGVLAPRNAFTFQDLLEES